MNDPRIEELKKMLPRAMTADWVRIGGRLARLIRDPRHQSRHGELLNRLMEETHASIERRERRSTLRPAIDYPPDLPITSRKDEIVQAIRDHQVVVIAGETGSGKTTQIPKMCLEAGLGIEGMIGCTQPRRVAAVSISRRVAEELGVDHGREVGCTIRFDDRTHPDTLIKMMTDGILLAETQRDRNLASYNALIIDEAHERSLNIDFLLGYLKGLLERRRDLKLIVTSATIDTQAFSRHFNNAPIIEVSGRLYPVEVEYRTPSEEEGEVHFVDAAVQEAERLILENRSGDILIFMPGEREIREVGDRLSGAWSGVVQVVPLFGRLSAADQQQVFAPTTVRKIVVATNIAETSLTIPGIRYVIDAGLARISRYNPRTRTKRLPVEPVSQSSANQRKGRAGRVREGTCIRLYSEEDFESRPAFTPPEIQRANLAEVILRMKAFHLGNMETFPFIEPPTPAAISNGYNLLKELGALDAEGELTPLGHDLANLPIDPTLGRMLLQSSKEGCVREILIIAAGLSIQDPRERPLDEQAAADAAHARFRDPSSDFLSLLNLWTQVEKAWSEAPSQNQRRKFCRSHFLNYLRMREWADLYRQLLAALKDRVQVVLHDQPASYDAIHRSILTGHLGHVARHEEANEYMAAGSRKVQVFPGSVLFQKSEKPKRGRNRPKAPPPTKEAKPQHPEWIVAGEIVETSRLYARSLAGIDPRWIHQLAPEQCQVSHVNPRWNRRSGKVLVDELIRWRGLETERRKVPFSKVDAVAARSLFIEHALVGERLLPSNRPGEPEDQEDLSNLPPQYSFLLHNRALREKAENLRTRLRGHHLPSPEDQLARFYDGRLGQVSSRDELNQAIRSAGSPDFLKASEGDLGTGEETGVDPLAFPDLVTIGGEDIPVQYRYAPGEEEDGVTLEVPDGLLHSLPPAALEWAVPGLREEKLKGLLRALPKSIRGQLLPLQPKVEIILKEWAPLEGAFESSLGRFIQDRFGISVPESAWPPDTLPSHLKTRFSILDAQGKSLKQSRDLMALRQEFLQPARPSAPAGRLWKLAADQWERFDLQDWTLGNFPERIRLGSPEDLPVFAYPGLALEDGSVSLRLFREPTAMKMASLTALPRLLEKRLGRELGWMDRDLRALARFESFLQSLGNRRPVLELLGEHLRRHLMPAEPWKIRDATAFEKALEQARQRMIGIVPKLEDALEALQRIYQSVESRLGTSPASSNKGPRKLTDFSQLSVPGPQASHPLRTELHRLMPPELLECTPFERLGDLQRYLQALQVRIQKAALQPGKEQERADQLEPFLRSMEQLERSGIASQPAARQDWQTLRWMMEEFRISLFAQEMGTSMPVSPKRLEKQLERLRALRSN